MACPKCGKVVSVTDRFCSGCYAPLEPPTFWRRLVSWFQSQSKSVTHTTIVTNTPVVTHTTVVKKTENIEVIGKSGEQHTYHSLAEVPPELREDIEKLEAQALNELAGGQPSTDSLTTPDRPGIITRQSTMLIKIKDHTGKEQTYHSVDEMPPDVRAKFEKMRALLGDSGAGGKSIGF
ncbi:MAG TPA: zinc ribbon domain-containing protein [Verrucomicrobiae bacterium]